MSVAHVVSISRYHLMTTLGNFRTYMFELDMDLDGDVSSVESYTVPAGTYIEFSSATSTGLRNTAENCGPLKFIGHSGTEYDTENTGTNGKRFKNTYENVSSTSGYYWDSTEITRVIGTILGIFKYQDKYWYANFSFSTYNNNGVFGTVTISHASTGNLAYYYITLDSSYTMAFSFTRGTAALQRMTDLVGAGGPEVVPIPDPYDPNGDGSGYNQGGPAANGGSGGGPAGTGGTGTTGTGGLHDDTSDAIPTPTTPSDVVVSSGIFTAYNPSASQLATFASALWNMQPTDINDVLRFLFGGDAFNAIIGMHLLPVAPSISGSQSIKLGNWDTGVSAPKISSQYAQVSFGSVLLPEYWGNCIDYAPYTRVQLALPYIGMVDVDTDDVLGSTNTLTYNIDVLSGALCAMLHCVKGNLTSVIYQWSGSCAVDLPITGANKNAIIGAIGASGVVTSMAFSAAGGGLLGGLAASAALAGSAASAYGTAKGKVQKNGNFGSHAGALGIMTPYFIVSRPVQSVPETWKDDKGYPANISVQLGTVLGYTEVSEINLECSGTEAEKKEIVDLLKKGVLF